jgi:hypothetical protein
VNGTSVLVYFTKSLFLVYSTRACTCCKCLPQFLWQCATSLYLLWPVRVAVPQACTFCKCHEPVRVAEEVNMKRETRHGLK